MTILTVKAAALGIVAGLALFTFPFFLLKSILFLVLFGLLARFFVSRRLRQIFGPGQDGSGRGYMRERFKNMTEEERKEFFAKMKYRGCHHSHHSHHPHTDDDGIVKPNVQ